MSAKRKSSPARKSTSPRRVTGSVEARQKVAAILEVLCGVRSPTEGAASMATSLTRYYVLEARALGAMVAALEPRARGKKRSADRELRELTRERDRLSGEVARLSALVRAAERTVGLPPVEEVAGRRRHKEPRGRRVARALRPVAPQKKEAAS